MAASKPLRDLLAQLNREVAVERLAAAQGVALERDGSVQRGKCPHHADHLRSLTIDPETNSWRCEGGCSGGSAVEWVMAARKLPRRKAVEWLRAEFLMAAGELGNRSKLPTPALDPLDPELDDQGLLADVLAHYQGGLVGSPEALDYLASRGLTHPELIPQLRLGYADRSLGYRMPAKAWKAGKKLRAQLQRLGVLKESGHETLRGSLVVPVFDAEGRIVDAYGRKIGRSLRKGTPLHTRLNDPATGIWNTVALHQYAEVIVAKSITDGLTWWSWGFRNVVAGPPGALVAAFRACDVDRLILAFDQSEPGHRAHAAIAEALANEEIERFAVRFPGDHDANSYACRIEAPQDGLAELLRAAEWVSGDAGRAVPAVEPMAAAAMPTPAPASIEGETRRSAMARIEVKNAIEGRSPEGAADQPTRAPAAPEVLASPVPDPAPVPPEEDAAETEIRLRFGDRQWRVRGLDRNRRYDSLRVNLMVRREAAEADPRTLGYHLDTLDLYGAKHRAGFVRAAASELSVEESVISRDMGRVLLRLEELQDEAIQSAREVEKAPPSLSEAERAEALELLRAPDLLDRIGADFARCGVVGEEVNKRVGYLAAVSRKLEDPLALLIQSGSAAGKTTLMEAILAFVPEEDRLAFSSITGQAAYYFAGGDLRHKVLAIAEEEGASRASYALKLLASEGRLSIASTGKDAATGRLTSHEYVVEGPISLVVSTTNIDVDPELENRSIVLEVSESRGLTQEIHRQQRERETLAGLLAKEEREGVLRLHRNAQRLLRPVKVVNPYARQLGFPDTTTRARRDHRKYLSLIRAVTFLHQHQRDVKKATWDGRAIEYIEVARDDIAVANRLAHAVLGRSLGSVPPQTRRLLALLVEMVDGAARAEAIARAEVRFTRRRVREHTGWGETQLKVHLRRLVDLEYVVVHRRAAGGLHQYELLFAGDPEDEAPRLAGLRDVEELREPESPGYDEVRPGLRVVRSESGRPGVGPRSGCRRPEGSNGTEGPSS